LQLWLTANIGLSNDLDCRHVESVQPMFEILVTSTLYLIISPSQVCNEI
jgi:hypothetical protein